MEVNTLKILLQALALASHCMTEQLATTLNNERHVRLPAMADGSFGMRRNLQPLHC
jgi:hypothetical protein